MNTYVAILRGINVSGQRVILMKDLKALFQKAGYENIMTYIQSWNIVFQSPEKDREILAKKITELIKNHFNFEVPVLIIPAHEIEKIITENPYNDGKKDIAKLHVTLLWNRPDVKLLSTTRDEKFQSDEFTISDTVIYLYCPDGYGMTKFSTTFFEKKLGVNATTRNWKTITALHDLIK